VNSPELSPAGKNTSKVVAPDELTTSTIQGPESNPLIVILLFPKVTTIPERDANRKFAVCCNNALPQGTWRVVIFPGNANPRDSVVRLPEGTGVARWRVRPNRGRS